MSFPKFSLDDSGRLMMTVAEVTNAETVAAQAYLMDSACVDAGAVTAGDSFNGGFRYTVNGALRVYDATAGLPASNSVNQGITMTDSGQACYTTAAIDEDDVSRVNGMAVSGNGRIYATVLDPVAWFRFNIGITETGQGVSTWADQSGEGNDLLQGTDGARPAKQSDGSILFNGTDEYLKCGAFTFSQPETVYLLARRVTATTDDIVFDGNANDSMTMYEPNSATPNRVDLFAGTGGPNSSAWVVNTYAAVCAVFSGADSIIQVNSTTSSAVTVGVANAGGFTLASHGGVAERFANLQAKEVILFPVAHDAATRLHMIRYLAHNGPVAL